MQIYSRLPEQIMQMVIDRARAGGGTSRSTQRRGQRDDEQASCSEALAMFGAVSKTGEPAMPLKMLRAAANIDDEEASIAYRQEHAERHADDAARYPQASPLSTPRSS
jgi:hypothetical protein